MDAVYSLLDSLDSLIAYALPGRLRGQFLQIRRELFLILANLEFAEESHDRDRAAALKDYLDSHRDDVNDINLFLEKMVDRAKHPIRQVMPKLFPIAEPCIFNRRTMREMKEIESRMDKFLNQIPPRSELRLENRGRSSSQVSTLESVDSFVNGDIVGRGEHEVALMFLLERGTTVVSILGVAGIGKTVLAQLVYYNQSVQSMFPVRAWVHVSRNFSTSASLENIRMLVSRNGVDDILSTWGLLQIALGMQGFPKVLIVLDDVWEASTLKSLIREFKKGAIVCGFVVTTRFESVALACESEVEREVHFNVFRPPRWSREDCVTLLFKIAGPPAEAVYGLREVALQLADKCEGLPSAVSSIAHGLRSRATREEWEKVLSDLNDAEQVLPSHLKRMFAYCAILPRKYAFTKDELLRLWISEGFLDHRKSRWQGVKELGFEYFDKLVSMSYFRRRSNSESLFEICEDYLEPLESLGAYHVYNEITLNQLPEEVRYLSLRFSDYDEGFRSHWTVGVPKKLRTLLLMHPSDGSPAKLSNRALAELLTKLSGLRVLSLMGCPITELPTSIGELKILRYLDLSATDISTLPDSIVLLVCLETLSIRHCKKMIRLPTALGDLPNLRHLENSGTSCELPSSIPKLKRLETLSEVHIVKRGGGFGLRELRILEHLGDSLTINGLHNGIVRDAYFCLENKSDLHSLTLLWGGDGNGAGIQEDVADVLQPHRNLKKLEVMGYSGSRFPSWIGDGMRNPILTSLTISECWNCTSLPCLGELPCLKHLKISYLPEVQSIGDEFFGSSGNQFSMLKTLTFDSMEKWKKWTVSREKGGVALFSRLEMLKIYHCEKLEEVFPISLPSLRDLNLRECGVLMGSIKAPLESLESFRMVEISAVRNLDVLRASSKLRSIDVYGCRDLKLLWTEGITRSDLSNLRSIKIDFCASLRFLVPKDQLLPCNIEDLELVNCPNLVSLPHDLVNLENCKRLEIRMCGKLVSFPENGIPSKLEFLVIQNYCALESFP